MKEPRTDLPPSMTQEGFEARAREGMATARKYYDEFGWIAEVTVEKHDPPSSRRLARRIALRAIECLQLLFGARVAGNMRLGEETLQRDRRGEIIISAKGAPYASWSIDWPVDNLGENWWSDLQNRVGGGMLVTLGAALRAAHTTPQPAPLAQRFMDGLSWYGEAIRDSSQASSIIKHVTAMERIVTTQRQPRVRKSLVDRGSAMIAEAGFEIPDFRARITALYTVRNKLVHGSRSPQEPSLCENRLEAGTLSRCLLYSFILFCGQKGLESTEISDDFLEQSYQRLMARQAS